MAVLDPVKVVITNYPADEGVTENKRMKRLDSEKYLSRELYIEREDFLEVPPKFFRLSGNEVRLKNGILWRISYKDSDGIITEIKLLMIMIVGGSGSEASQRKVAGTLHWVSMDMQFLWRCVLRSIVY
jgi:glutaminyl-tRNA synthetase